MKTYACISERDGSIAHVRDYDEAVVAAMAPAKRQWYREIVLEAKPGVSATQEAFLPPAAAPWVGFTIEPTQVRVTWQVRELTAAEIDAKTDAAELAMLQQVVTALKAGSGTAADRLVRLERVAVWLIKQAAKRGVA